MCQDWAPPAGQWKIAGGESKSSATSSDDLDEAGNASSLRPSPPPPPLAPALCGVKMVELIPRVLVSLLQDGITDCAQHAVALAAIMTRCYPGLQVHITRPRQDFATFADHLVLVWNDWRSRRPHCIIPNLRELFTIARPTGEYEELLGRVPDVFVGSHKQLMNLVGVMCDAMKESFKKQDLSMAPWRSREAFGRALDLENLLADEACHLELMQLLRALDSIHSPLQKENSIPAALLESVVRLLSGESSSKSPQPVILSPQPVASGCSNSDSSHSNRNGSSTLCSPVEDLYNGTSPRSDPSSTLCVTPSTVPASASTTTPTTNNPDPSSPLVTHPADSQKAQVLAVQELEVPGALLMTTKHTVACLAPEEYSEVGRGGGKA